jgi:hypothetical protein
MNADDADDADRVKRIEPKKKTGPQDGMKSIWLVRIFGLGWGRLVRIFWLRQQLEYDFA